jgi:hypothetical protein
MKNKYLNCRGTHTFGLCADSNGVASRFVMLAGGEKPTESIPSAKIEKTKAPEVNPKLAGDEAKENAARMVEAGQKNVNTLAQGTEAIELSTEDVKIKAADIFNNFDYPFSELQTQIVAEEGKSSTPASQEKLRRALGKLGVSTDINTQPQPGSALNDMYRDLWANKLKVKKTQSAVERAIKGGQYGTMKAELDAIITKELAAYDEVFGKGKGKIAFATKRKEANS